MRPVIKTMPPALKHGAYSTTSVLPGESAAEFAKLHRELVTEWGPNGALEDDIVATMARALWRKNNLDTLRIARLAQERMAHIHDATVPYIGEYPPSDQSNQLERTFVEKCQAAEQQARKELGEQYALVEMGEEATIDHLMRDLEVQERLDAVIDRCIKRLLMVRGLKSMSIGRASAPLQARPGTSSA